MMLRGLVVVGIPQTDWLCRFPNETVPKNHQQRTIEEPCFKSAPFLAMEELVPRNSGMCVCVFPFQVSLKPPKGYQSPYRSCWTWENNSPATFQPQAHLTCLSSVVFLGVFLLGPLHGGVRDFFEGRVPAPR